MHHHNLRASAALLLLATGVLPTASLVEDAVEYAAPEGAYSALEPPRFVIHVRRDRLSLAGFTTSARQEQQLRRIVAEHFADRDARVDLRRQVLLPQAWDNVTARLLTTLAATATATAEIEGAQIRVRAVTDDSSVWSANLASLRSTIADDFDLVLNVEVVAPLPGLDVLCHRAMAEASAQAVSFGQSSAEIRPASFAVLDRIVDIANDCRDSAIEVTGHTDASGDESWNRQLSQARARAVAEYLGAHGIDSRRLIAIGAGSSTPIANNSSAYGRRLNRRIEVSLHAPESI